jgi:hypothetical protein
LVPAFFSEEANGHEIKTLVNGKIQQEFEAKSIANGVVLEYVQEDNRALTATRWNLKLDPKPQCQ